MISSSTTAMPRMRLMLRKRRQRRQKPRICWRFQKAVHEGISGEKNDAMKKTKEQLKRLFANGSMPDGDSFGQLIDSLALDASLSGLADKLNQAIADADARLAQALLDSDGKTRQALTDSTAKTRQALTELQAKVKQALLDADAKTTQRLQDADAKTTQQLLDAENRVAQKLAELEAGQGANTLSVPADGQWHTIVNGTTACAAFTVIACASGAGQEQAITHANAVSTASGGGLCSIRQTRSFAGWGFWRRISLRWSKQALQIRTHAKYKPVNGAIPAIQYHLTRLW
jgi:hypothetical protein